jgi:hypothetical protein
MALALVETVQVEIGINQEWLDEWVAYRAEDLSKPMTPRAIKMLTKKLIQWSELEQERLICNAIEMNWKGVYWVEPMKQAATSTRDTSILEDLTNTDWAT